jgi:hypothetical protein
LGSGVITRSDAFENLVMDFLIELGENSRDNGTARRLPARLNASEEITPTTALEEAEAFSLKGRPPAITAAAAS